MLFITQGISGGVRDDLESQPFTFREYYNQVKPNGPWGYKNGIYEHDKEVKIGDIVLSKDVAGNIAYGFSGAAAGYEKETLLVMGGLAQVHTDLASYGEAKWQKNKSYDDSRDQAQISLGYDLYIANGTNLNSQDLIEAVNNNLECIE